jgi:diguanylate cyclase (GGDEF)-like protein
VLEQEPLLLNDADVASEVYREVKLEHDFVSAVIAPVVKNRRGVGYIFCDRAAGTGPFTSADLLHLQVIGYLIGNHIEKFELIKQSKKLSRFDDATGILQYKAFIPALGVEIERAHKHRYGVVLALLSVGAFRKYVETYGIDRAHALLADVAKTMGRRLSEMDLLARFGADEIVVCMSGQTGAEATAKLQAMREDVRQGVIGETDEPVDVAIGALHLSGERDLKRMLQEILAELGKSLVEAKTKHAGAVVLRELGTQGQS